ncbi:MAG: hypothetical protein KA802_09205 [Saprospiraceae bacterium]|nr:hypothetical protein [Saprospiraceae bacterium]
MSEVVFNKSQLDAVALVLFSLLKDESGKPGQTFGSIYHAAKFNNEILLKCEEVDVDVPDEIYQMIGRPLGTPLPGSTKSIPETTGS